MALFSAWSVQIAGRLVAGAGGVLLSVQLTKMVTDWFAGAEIATAMAIFVSSWPTGIALSLLTLPFIGTTYGISAAYFTVVAFIAAGFILLAVAYQAPASSAAPATKSAGLERSTIIAVVIAGLIWGLYNVGFALIFSFGPSMLVERGWSISTAASTISIALWLAVIIVPLGGFIADRSGRPQFIVVVGCIVSAILMVMLPRNEAVVLIVVALGLISGQPAGAMMSLPARVLRPETRAIGMGIFYTLYYGAMMLGPIVAGACIKWTGSAAAAFDLGALVVLTCPVLLWCFNRVPTRCPSMT
jgi:predicted MFS family arabinose efflux permease